MSHKGCGFNCRAGVLDHQEASYIGLSVLSPHLAARASRRGSES